jgi:trehalose 6-phosphate synthase
MGSRLIIVSNRVAVPEPAGNQKPGGLAVAVKAALRNRTGLWFGWSGKAKEETDSEPRLVERNKITYVVIDISTNDFQEYYNGFANRVLWPILHYRVDLAEFSRADLSGYMRVNRLFADKLGELIEEDDVIWVHDYHLMPLAKELRARGHANPIGFYLHIPCAPPDILVAIPRHQEILGSLSFYDLVGFQTENDTENFRQYLVGQGAKPGRDGQSFTIDGRQLRVGAFPVSIETAAYARLARTASRSSFAQEIEASTASIIPRASCIASTPSIASWKRIPIGARASLSFRSPRIAAPTSRNMPRSRTRSRASSGGSTAVTARPPGRRSATSTASIHARRWPASIGPPTSRSSRRCGTA